MMTDERREENGPSLTFLSVLLLVTSLRFATRSVPVLFGHPSPLSSLPKGAPAGRLEW